MAFPTSLDDLSTSRASSGSDKLSSPDHLTHHVNEDTAIQSLETKIGVDSSAVATSLDYLVKSASSTNPGHKHPKAAITDLPTLPSGAIVGTTDTQTLTNKRGTKRVGSTTSSATPTINTDNVDIYRLTAQAEAITSFTTNLSGTPVEGDMLLIEITGTAARAITWGTSFEASTVALPTTTVTTAMLQVLFKWNSVTSKWRCLASV